MTRILVFGALIAATACGGSQKTDAGNTGTTQLRGIAAAALPYRVVRVEGGREVSLDEMLRDIATADAVCIGETHTNPHDHWAQLTLVDHITAQNEKGDITTALGMEMFQRPFQGVLDDFAAKKIDDKALLSRSGWAQRWGYDWNLYKPILELARDRNAALLALNISNELKVKVREKGVDDLAVEDKSKIPELELDNKTHRAWWSSLMESMGGAEGHKKKKPEDSAHEDGGDKPEESKPEESKPEEAKPDEAKPDEAKPEAAKPDDGKDDAKPDEGKDKDKDKGESAKTDEQKAKEAKARAERMYMIQILWDETMADTAARWVRGGIKRQVVIIAGNGHCHDSAIVHRVQRRGVKKAVSIRPVIDKADGEVAALLASPENDYLFVMEMPGGGGGGEGEAE